jgi:4-amino-4-deoxy-L-arabinose transferase-like glycosyltransferase
MPKILCGASLQNWIGRLNRWFASPVHHMAILLIMASFLLIPNLNLGDLSAYDDAFYAHVGKQMLITGDWWNLRFNGQPHFNYPPLFLWMEAASMKILGCTDFAAKFPSALSALFTIGLVFLIAREFAAGFWFPVFSAWILMLTPYYMKYSTHAMTDSPFTFLVALSLYLYLKSFKSPAAFLGSGAAMGLALMTRTVLGLIPLLVMAGHIVLTGRLRLLRSAWLWAGILLAMLLPGSWFFTQYLIHGSEFLIRHFAFIFSKAGGSAAGAGGPAWHWLYGYPLRMVQSYWPWIPLVLGGLIVQSRKLWQRRDDLSAFLVVWSAAVLIPFSLAEVKSIRYIMAVFPAFSMLAALAALKWLPPLKEKYRLPVYACLCAMVIMIALFPTPRHRAEDMQVLGPVAREHSDPSRRLILYAFGKPDQGPLVQLLWYSDRFCDLETDQAKLYEALQATVENVLIMDKTIYRQLPVEYKERLLLLRESPLFVCVKTMPLPGSPSL